MPGAVTQPTAPSGIAPRTTYDYLGVTLSGWPPFYLPSSQMVKVSATRFVLTNTSYNTSNKFVPMTRTVDVGSGKLNLVTTFGYDDVGNLILVDGPRTDVTDTVATSYNSERRPLQTTNALGQAQSHHL